MLRSPTRPGFALRSANVRAVTHSRHCTAKRLSKRATTRT